MQRLDRRHFLIATGGVLLAAACGGSNNASSAGGSSPAATSSAASSASGANTGSGATALTGTLRLGFFPNLTHAQPNVALQNGAFARTLGDGVKLDMSKSFNSGTTAIEALLAGELDACYLGPNPAITGFVRSNGKDVRIIAGATSGGALLVVRADTGISAAGDFADKKVATPSLGNTQDVALRSWLKQNGLGAREQGGNVSVVPTANANTLSLMQQKQIDAAWVPEPWGTRLIQEAGGRLFLDERDLWPNRQFVTTHLVVKPGYMDKNQGIIEALLRSHVEVTQYIQANASDAKSLVNTSLEKLTQAALSPQVIDSAWKNIDITFDPVASSLEKNAADAYDAGFLDSKPDLTRIYDLTLLNKVLKEKNLAEVKGLG